VESNISTGFYHWKSTLSLDTSESTYLQNLQTSKLYLRYFDVEWAPYEKAALPISIISIDTSGIRDLEIIPTVFITNKTMRNLPSEDCPDLVQNIVLKINSLTKELSNQKISEIQIDCDWTRSSKDTYFNFLNLLKSELATQGITLSTTLRLHQYRDRESTGIPPVDRVMLMFYNMGEVNDYKETNSILNLPAALHYLNTDEAYPLPLDMALPLFKWGCIFRDQNLIHLSNDLSEKELRDTSRFIKMENDYFRVIKSTYLKGYFLYSGDEIRLESVSYNLLEQSVDLLQKVKNANDFSIVFYHLDICNINQFSPKQLNELLLKLE
jgi:hypothetical protein